MILAHYGIERNQDDIARELGMIENAGVPASNVLRLRSRKIHVEYGVESDLAAIRGWLERDVPVIACVQTAMLPYWEGHNTQHAVLVVGIDAKAAYIVDPAMADAVYSPAIEEFLLAWDEMLFTYIVVYQ